ncbi:hypothetical protein HDU79_009659 [Rhizoclosmatium sp. JEL0117]|nr:hypothetical protein HDU79_009659 [Rhizoclosmatium sp. JEL0117]
MYNIDTVRSIALTHGLVLLSHNEALGTLSYKYPGLEWRITVYYVTQTVSVTIADSVGKDQSSYIRHGVNLKELDDIFATPKSGKRRQDMGTFRIDSTSTHKPLPRQKESETTIKDDFSFEQEEEIIREHLETLQLRVNECQETLHKFLWERKKEEAQDLRLASKRLLRAISAEKTRKTVWDPDEAPPSRYSSPKQPPQSRYEYSLTFPEGFPSTPHSIRCIAITPEGGYIKINNSGSYFCRKAPSVITQLLDHQKGGIDYISLGPKKQYLIQLLNGHIFCDGSKDFKSRMEMTMKTVQFVTFGRKDAYFVQFDDGSCIWNGIPKQVEEFVMKRGNKLDWLWLSAGDTEKEGFFASANQGKVTLNGFEFPRYLDDLLHKRRVKAFQYFEESVSYFVEYQ